MHIGIIVFSYARSDPRVRRQIDALRHDGHRITVFAFGAPVPGCDWVALPDRRRHPAIKALHVLAMLLRWPRLAYLSAPHVAMVTRALASRRLDLIIANDFLTLPLAHWRRPRLPVIYDAHEYAPLEAAERRWWRLLDAPMRRALCARYLPRCARVTTVGWSLAARFARYYAVRPRVITNAIPHQELRPAPLPPADEPLRAVHVGAALPGRGIETLIDAIARLAPRYSLDLYLVGPEERIARLRARAAGCAAIRFHAPVPMPAVARQINGCDLGLFVLPPISFNKKHALPNKLFEFIQARLGVVVGPSPEMARLVRAHGVGAVSNDFTADALVAVLAGLERERERVVGFKQASDRLAATLHAEAQARRLRAVVRAVARGAR